MLRGKCEGGCVGLSTQQRWGGPPAPRIPESFPPSFFSIPTFTFDFLPNFTPPIGVDVERIGAIRAHNLSNVLKVGPI